MIGGQTVLWREFPLTKEQSFRTIQSAVRAVQCYAMASLGQSEVNAVTIHSRDAAEFAEGPGRDLGIRIIAVEEDLLDETTFSYGLALAAKSGEQTPFDLFRSLRSSPTILSIFPWKRAALVATAACVMLGIMWSRAAGIDGEYRSLKRQNAERKWAHNKRTSGIKAERKLLEAEVTAVSRFVSTRVLWSNYLRDVPTRVPSNAGLSNFEGFCELKEESKKEEGRRAKRSLSLRGMTRFPRGLAAPEEIDAFLESLRNVDLLKKDFPQVKLAEIKWRREGASEVAMFTVMALPNKEKSSDGTGGEGEEGTKERAVKQRGRGNR